MNTPKNKGSVINFDTRSNKASELENQPKKNAFYPLSSRADNMDTVNATIKITASIIQGCGYENLKEDNLLQLLKIVHNQVETYINYSGKAKNPVVPIEKSVFPDHLVCLQTGKRIIVLAKHVKKLGLTVEQYKEKWNLSSDYPSVAPNYSESRRLVAKKSGLGKGKKQAKSAYVSI